MCEKINVFKRSPWHLTRVGAMLGAPLKSFPASSSAYHELLASVLISWEWQSLDLSTPVLSLPLLGMGTGTRAGSAWAVWPENAMAAMSTILSVWLDSRHWGTWTTPSDTQYYLLGVQMPLINLSSWIFTKSPRIRMIWIKQEYKPLQTQLTQQYLTLRVNYRNPNDTIWWHKTLQLNNFWIFQLIFFCDASGTCDYTVLCKSFKQVWEKML